MSYLFGLGLVDRKMFDLRNFEVEMDGEKKLLDYRGVAVYGMSFEVLNMSFTQTENLQVLGGELNKGELFVNLVRALLREKKLVPDFVGRELSFPLNQSVEEIVIKGVDKYILDGERYKNEPEVKLSPWATKFVKL